MIKHFDLKQLGRNIAPVILPEGWTPAAFGGLKGRHFSSEVHATRAKTVHTTTQPSINESAFELSVELSVMQAIPGPEMTFIELGAGWGAQSLNIATIAREQVVPLTVQNVTSYAVEAEPGHYGFLCETFVANRLPGLPIYGAISDAVGWLPFRSFYPAADNYGQSLKPDGNIQVPVYTLAYLVNTFNIAEVDLVHMDIQGSEPEAVAGALPVIDRFRFLLVCPHRPEHIPQITEMLEPTHSMELCLPPASGYHDVPGFPLPVHIPQDGIMLWTRR